MNSPDAQSPLFHRAFVLELLATALLVGLLLWGWKPLTYLLERAITTLHAKAPTNPGCRAPTEHELLLISVAQRGERQVVVGCTYTGPEGAYHRRSAR